MKKSTAIAVCLLGAAGLFWFVQAGDLEPPGPPAPTLVTLQEIYDRVSASPVGIPKTAQTGCWDQSGSPVDCAGTGQDGEYQFGVSVNPRLTDNLDGTVRDNLTGLTWLKNADCFGLRNWTNALSDANTLADGSCGLTDGSVPGDWHLPNVRELHSLIDYGQYGPALPLAHPFLGVQSGVGSGYYWSSNSGNYTRDAAWIVYLGGGRVDASNKNSTWYVWPVRGGQ